MRIIDRISLTPVVVKGIVPETCGSGFNAALGKASDRGGNVAK
jgi:hypothetical protein